MEKKNMITLLIQVITLVAVVRLTIHYPKYDYITYFSIWIAFICGYLYKLISYYRKTGIFN